MRRNRGPASRRGPGLVGTMARTAVIAGTATAVSNSVSGAMNQSAQSSAALKQQQLEATVQAQLTAQQAAAPPPPAPEPAPVAAPVAAAAAPAPDRITLLKDLAALREMGVLTEEEFQAEKQRIMGS